MTVLVPITMLGWIPVGLWIFNRYRGRTAVIIGFLVAWLFLPVYNYSLPGLPDYSKISALSYVMLIGVLLFDRTRLAEFKLHLFDLPILVFCFSSFFSSVTNGLGAYDGLSATLGKITVWFIPYLLGRLYFDNLEALRDLVFGIFLGGLIYIPFCMFEMVMSPRLHRIVYGFHPHLFGQSRRWGGWRPVVFMQHGLMVGMWMTTASLAGLHLMKTGAIKKWQKYLKPKPAAVIGFLIVVAIFCKSTGAIFLLLAGWTALRFSIKMKLKIPLYALMLIPAVYVTLRMTGLWSGEGFIELLSEKLHLPEERVGSLSFRFTNEDMLMDKAFVRPWFGWGGWKRSFVFDSAGTPISVPDGLWILILGQNGLIGLGSMLLSMALPQWFYLKRFTTKDWNTRPLVCLGLAPVVLVALFSIDGLLNDMFNPLIMLLAGGMTGLYLRKSKLEDDTSGNLPVEKHPQKPRLL